MNVFDANVAHNIWEFIPLITIRVLHENHPLAPDYDVFIYVVRTGTTVAGIKKKLLDARFRKFGWLPDEMTLRWRFTDLPELCDDHELVYDAKLMLNLYPRIKYESDEESEEDDESEEELEDTLSFFDKIQKLLIKSK